MVKLKLLLFVLVISITSCNKAPICSIDSPADGQKFSTADSIYINVSAEDEDGTITGVVLYVDGTMDSSIATAPYHFVIPGGILTAGTHTLKVEATDNEGKIEEASVSITLTQKTYVVGEIYDLLGVQGKVYKITDDGTHGMICSIDITELKWSNDNASSGALDEDNGITNMNTIKQNHDINNFPAFKWCDDKNTGDVSGWYLPAIHELREVFNARDSLNIPFLTEQDVWSSTEKEEETTSAWIISFDMNSPYDYAASKYRTCAVIAVKEF